MRSRMSVAVAALCVAGLAAVPAGGATCAGVRPVGTWTTVDLPFSTSRPDYSWDDRAARHPSARLSLAADPAVPGRLFVTDGEQLMRSVDGGCTWARVFATGTPAGTFGDVQYDIVQILVGGGPGPNRPVFVLVNNRDRLFYSYSPGSIVESARLYRSLDGGAKFSLVPIKGPAAQQCDRKGSAPSASLAASATDARRLYLTCRTASPARTYLYVSTDAGTTWSQTWRAGLPEDRYAPVEVDPGNPRVLYTALFDKRSMDVVADTATWDVTVWSSANGGMTWAPRRKAAFLDTHGASRITSTDGGGVTTFSDGRRSVIVAWHPLGLMTSLDGARSWRTSQAPAGYDIESVVPGQTADGLLVYLRPVRRPSCPATLDSAQILTAGPMFDRYTTVAFTYRPSTGAWQPVAPLRVAPETLNSVLGPALRVRGSGSSVRYVSLESGSTAGCKSDGSASPAGLVSEHLVVYNGRA